MPKRSAPSTPSWNDFLGPNYGYVLELYEEYLQDPLSVEPEIREYFERTGEPIQKGVQAGVTSSPLPDSSASNIPSPGSGNVRNVEVGVAGVKLARNIRRFGHLSARLDPLGSEPSAHTVVETASYGITDEDLKSIPAKWVWRDHPPQLQTGYDAISYLRQVYTGTMAYDFGHVTSDEELSWLTSYVESGQVRVDLRADDEKSLWFRLLEVEQFETYLHRTFVGQKRFSIEGLDILVPMLDWLIERSVDRGTRYVSMGMAHRGRLNVLAHVLRKPYETIFSEFHASPNKDLVPSEGSTGINYGWTGDVKYHLGAHRTVDEGDFVEARLMLANNPSHLEFVDPVVVGSTRAAQDDRSVHGIPTTDPKRALAVLIHGDAAFPGEGVVAETLNMSRLPGYQVGGVIHLIANNQLGFTAEAHESRSTTYASDLAKGFEIPIVHVSADNPEDCISAVLMAHAYREQFHKDFLIDVIGYRRWGHNEMDDPAATQPILYGHISDHETVRSIYEKRLVEKGLLTEEDASHTRERVLERLQSAYTRVKEGNVKPSTPKLPPVDADALYETGVDGTKLRTMNRELLKWPDSFTVYSKLERILTRRGGSVEGDGKVDFATAEALAFASILSEGTPIRFTGQDTERGTFGHRHLVLHDYKTGERYIPLAHLSTNQASFDVHNSPLSETGPLGFEYGYDVQAEDALVLWEAQFGDFANVAQVIIDQFIASGRAKWGQNSSLVLLLPHGYEGQGPEHSSGRLERFLQLSAENNWIVANVTSAAQYFHLLRAQAKRLQREPCPLIVMTPKSLLRNPLAASVWQELESNRFRQVVVDEPTGTDSEDVSRAIVCSGKVAIDLVSDLSRTESSEPRPVVCRLEQLYPFPSGRLREVLSAYPNLKELVWVQEEPRNMGAWSYARDYLHQLVSGPVSVRYVGRAPHASPAEGLADVHQKTQQQLVQTALSKALTGYITDF